MTEITEHQSESEFRLVHAIPGRVRLRTSNSQPRSAIEAIAQRLRQQEGIREVRINPSTNSAIAEFDINALTLPQMLEKLQLAGVSETTQKDEPIQISDLGSHSARVGRSLIPLLAGMLVTAALGVEGIMAVPVYMVASNVTREAIKQFEPESHLSAQSKTSQKTTAKLQEKSAAQNGNGRLKTPHPTVTYSIVHAIPGRIRFRVPRIATDAEYTRKLTLLAESDPKVIQVRVNSAAASIAISYERHLISDQQMQEHLINLIQSAPDAVIPIGAKTAASEEESDAEPNLWANLALPALSTTLSLLGGPLGLPIPPLIIGGTIAIASLPVAQRTLESIWFEHKLNIDFLDLAAITITTVQGHFISPALMLLLIETGEGIREQTARSSKKQSLDLLDSLEQVVWVERNGEKQQISIHDVKPGDIVIVYPGSQIPVDGRILRGKALIDEQKLTGESIPVMRSKGQSVYTSTLVREGQLYIRAEHVGADTRAGQIIKVMQDAPVHDTRIENYAAKIADRAVIPTLLLSGIVFAITRNPARAASVLTLDFATGIRVSVPTTVLAALTHAARRGILIRSGRALEKLAQVDAIVFDKTGTLTQGEAVVVSVEAVNESTSPLEVLELAAAAEQRLTHPVAAAVVRYAQEKGAKILPRGKWEYQIGLGVRAQIDGKTILVGSDRFMQEENISLEHIHDKYPYLQAGSHSIIYVASNGELKGVIAYRDPLRPESREVIKALRQEEGTDIHILTGDNKRTAAAVAHELGIASTHTHAEAFPEKKVAVVKGLHSEGRTVAFVGDGINDSPALAYADVSVSFGNGSDVARETADVVLMENNLHGLPEAIAIARQAMQLIHQNTAIIAVPNLSALVLAALVGIDPLAATLVNNGSAIVAGVNGLRPLLGSSEDLDQLAANLEQSSNQPHKVVSLLDAIAQPPTPETPPVEEPPTSAVIEVPTPIESVQVVSAAPTEEEIEPLTGRALARRLNVSASTISKRKTKPDFLQWSRSHDPQEIAWTYLTESQMFAPVSLNPLL